MDPDNLVVVLCNFFCLFNLFTLVCLVKNYAHFFLKYVRDENLQIKNRQCVASGF